MKGEAVDVVLKESEIGVVLRNGESPVRLGLKRPVGSGEPLVVRSPWDGHEVARIPTTTPKELDETLDRAVAAFQDYRWMPTWKRYKILNRASRLIEEHQEQIARLIAAEAAKPLKAARIEANRSMSTFRWAAEEAKRTAGEIIEMHAEESGQDRFGWTIREPRGVISAIAPFNFPLNLVSHKVAPALASGNVVVLKPASSTPLTSLFLAGLLEGAGLADDVLQVVVGSGRLIGTPMVKDDRVAMVTFTGSPPVGRQIASDAGMKRVTLELGSNSATIVDEDADIDLAVGRIVAGGFTFSGQVCISVQRVIIHQKVYDEVLAKLVEGVEKLKWGDPMDPETDVSSLISPEETERVASWVQEAVDMGARLVTGGPDGDGVFRPAVLVDVTHEMKVCRAEIFGPVVSVVKAKDLCRAIEIANESDYGLQAGVFTNDLNKALYAARRLEVGGVMINEVPSFRVDHMPYGGIKGSGLGREGVKYAIQEMTEMKMVAIREIEWCPVDLS
jgi:acyl-CoA reductase-like NAD-dependent aldehyde dehydrogenase